MKYRSALIIILFSTASYAESHYFLGSEIESKQVKISGDAPVTIKETIVYALKQDKPNLRIYGDEISIDSCKENERIYKCEYLISYPHEFLCWTEWQLRTYRLGVTIRNNGTVVFGQVHEGLNC